MAVFVNRIGVAALAVGLSVMALAQVPYKDPPAVAGRRVMRSPTAPATPTPSAAPKPAGSPKPSTAQPPQPVQTQAPPQPAAPPRPEQMAPIAPLVTYQNGQLSIVAQNCTLGAILSAVRARTGAQVDVPADAANDRVAANLGPGNPRDVLASLLQGSRFDYILLGSLDDANAVSQIVLTRRLGGPATGTAVAGGNPGPSPGGSSQPGPPGPFAGGAARPEINAEEDEPEPVPQPEPAPAAQNPPPQPGVYQPGTMVQPGVPGAAVQPAPGQQVPPIQPNPQVPGQPGQVRTPEQLLQELQRMQQQQQQRQQQPQQN